MRGTPFSTGQLSRVQTRINNVLPRALRKLDPKDVLRGLDVDGSTALLEKVLADAMARFSRQTHDAGTLLQRNGEVVIGPHSTPLDLREFYKSRVRTSESRQQSDFFDRQIMPANSTVDPFGPYKVARFLFRENRREEHIIPILAMRTGGFAFTPHEFLVTVAMLVMKQNRGQQGDLLVQDNDFITNHFYVKKGGDLRAFTVTWDVHLVQWKVLNHYCGSLEEPNGSGAAKGAQLFLPLQNKK